MYASQVWTPSFLRQGKQMDNPIQKRLLMVLKRILMVRDTTLLWCVMHMRFGALSIQLVPCGNAAVQFTDTKK